MTTPEQPVTCLCDTERWEGEGCRMPCAEFAYATSFDICTTCGHWEECHVEAK